MFNLSTHKVKLKDVGNCDECVCNVCMIVLQCALVYREMKSGSKTRAHPSTDYASVHERNNACENF